MHYIVATMIKAIPPIHKCHTNTTIIHKNHPYKTQILPKYIKNAKKRPKIMKMAQNVIQNDPKGSQMLIKWSKLGQEYHHLTS